MDDKIFYALESYFRYLSNYGYMSYDKVYKLILYIYIVEFIHQYADLLCIEDYNGLLSKLNCLEDSLCLLPVDVQEQFKVWVNSPIKKNHSCK